MVLAGLVLTVVLGLRDSQGFGLGGRIAVLDIDGVISDDEDLLEQIRKFRDDASVKGFLVRINSPGGVVGPSQSIFEELKKLRDEEELPVIAAIGGVGASGGYYIALGADSIFALPGSITGSIGVIMEYPDASELMDKVGVQMQVVKSAEHKDVGSPFRPITPGDRQILNELVSDVYQQFVETVATERNLSRDIVASVADGRILSGRQALTHGLIDRLGNSNDALAAVGRMAGLGNEPRVIYPPRQKFGMLDLLMDQGTGGILSRLVRPLEQAGPRIKFVMP